MNTIQDILYAKALADAQYRETDNTGMAVGALTGTAFGAAAAPTRNTRGLKGGELVGAVGRNTGRRLAGALVGAIVGGGLGEGVKRIAMRESPAANMLAKIQAQGGMTEQDEQQLEFILRDLYNQEM